MQLGSLDQLKDHSGSVRAAAFDDFGNWDYDSLEKYKPVLKELFEGGCQAASALLLRMLTNVSEDVRIIALETLAPKKLKPEAIAAIFELAKYDSVDLCDVDVLDLLDEVQPEMLNPHVGALVAMLEEFGRQLPSDDNEDFGKALSLLRKVEPTHLENHVRELLKAMSMGLDIEWREEVESLLHDIPNVDWDLYVDEICDMLGGEDMYDHLDFLAKLSPQIRPKVVFENDEQTVFYLERRHEAS